MTARRKGVSIYAWQQSNDENGVDNATEFNPDKMLKLFNIGCGFGSNGAEWQDDISIDENDNR